MPEGNILQNETDVQREEKDLKDSVFLVGQIQRLETRDSGKNFQIRMLEFGKSS
jgi:hypothetical protein